MRLLGAVAGALMLVACGSGSATGLGIEQAQGTGGFDGVFPFDGGNIPGTVASGGAAQAADAGSPAPVDAGPDLGTLVVHWTFLGKRDASYCAQIPLGFHVSLWELGDNGSSSADINAVPCDAFEASAQVRPGEWQVSITPSPTNSDPSPRPVVTRGQTTDVTVDFR